MSTLVNMRRNGEAIDGPEWAGAWPVLMHHILREALRVLPKPLLPPEEIGDGHLTTNLSEASEASRGEARARAHPSHPKILRVDGARVLTSENPYGAKRPVPGSLRHAKCYIDSW